MLHLGIDEAGRGPVIGPMVYAVATCRTDCLESLTELNLADSKILAAQQRENLFEKICQTEGLEYVVDIIEAKDISTQMLQENPTNLNQIAMNSTCKLLKQIVEAGAEIEHVYVDTLGKPEKHKARLEIEFPGIQFTVKAKADAHYPIVSMASIVAKVIRDREIEKIQEKYTEPFGSGYPSDPVTKAWLESQVDPVFGYPSEVRFSWSTCQKILEKRGVSVAWGKKGRRQATLDQPVRSKKNRPVFFRTRRIEGVHCDLSFVKLQRLS